MANGSRSFISFFNLYNLGSQIRDAQIGHTVVLGIPLSIFSLDQPQNYMRNWSDFVVNCTPLRPFL